MRRHKCCRAVFSHKVTTGLPEQRMSMTCINISAVSTGLPIVIPLSHNCLTQEGNIPRYIGEGHKGRYACRR